MSTDSADAGSAAFEGEGGGGRGGCEAAEKPSAHDLQCKPPPILFSNPRRKIWAMLFTAWPYVHTYILPKIPGREMRHWSWDASRRKNFWRHRNCNLDEARIFEFRGDVPPPATTVRSKVILVVPKHLDGSPSDEASYRRCPKCYVVHQSREFCQRKLSKLCII
jgi:hypothetical protein